MGWPTCSSRLMFWDDTTFLHHRPGAQACGQQSIERPWWAQAQCGLKCTVERNEIRQNDKWQKGRLPKTLLEQQIWGPSFFQPWPTGSALMQVPGEQEAPRPPPQRLGPTRYSPEKGRRAGSTVACCYLPGRSPHCPTASVGIRPSTLESLLGSRLCFHILFPPPHSGLSTFLRSSVVQAATPSHHKTLQFKISSHLVSDYTSRAQISHYCSAQIHPLSKSSYQAPLNLTYFRLQL